MQKHIGDTFYISILLCGFLLALALAPSCEAAADEEGSGEHAADAPVPREPTGAEPEAGATELSI